ncbi:unnamed protein product, partial [Choristocarpus tenellus]
RDPPPDVCDAAYGIFFLQGVGQLFPWNVFINAEDYFRRRLCGTPYEKNFENFFSIGYNVMAVLGLGFVLRYQRRFNQRLQVLGALSVSTLVFMMSMLLVLVVEMSGTVLFNVTMVLVNHLCSMLCQGGLFAFAGAFPPRYTQAMMLGQGLAGLSVSIAGLFTTLSGPDATECVSDEGFGIDLTSVKSQTECKSYEVDISSLVYFGIACGILLACMISFPVLERLPIPLEYTRNTTPSSLESVLSETLEAQSSLMKSEHGERERGWISPIEDSRGSLHYSQQSILEEHALDDTVVNQDKNNFRGSRGIMLQFSGLQPLVPFAVGVFSTFAVTLALFPATTSKIMSSRQCIPGQSRFFAEDVFVMFSFVSFNLFDFIGRLVAGLPQQLLSGHMLSSMAAARVVFIPLFLACRLQGSRFPQWLHWDVFPLALMPLFSFSNGFVGSHSMMAGPHAVCPQMRDFAGTSMVFCLSMGLLVGSVLSFFTLYFSTGSFS